jgi:ABC-type polysaccharide/polyol phosphate transport system ATPase subunit
MGVPVASEPVVCLEHVSVRYRAPEQRLGSLKEFVLRSLREPVRMREFCALEDVSLSVERGETLGIIGPNGAGKSTLLRVVARVLAPSSGRLRTRGRISPLLELGAGFHPELTGRENVLLNGTLLGHTRRETLRRMADILDFAGLDGFVDAPLRTYSSGMAARLGFAVATAWEPEILLMDETLAVGEESFRARCLERLQGFRRGGTTLLLVSHDLGTVRSVGDRAAWLDRGRIRLVAAPDRAISAYRESLSPAGTT